MIADLDTVLTAVYVELTDHIIAALGFARRGPAKPPEVTDAELVCLAATQVLLRYDDERHWLRAAPKLIGHLFPRLLGQSGYNDRVKALAPLMEAALRWAGRSHARVGGAGAPDGRHPTPMRPPGHHREAIWPCQVGGLRVLPSHSRWYWGSKLLLLRTCDGTVTGFGLANPKLYSEREQAREMLKDQPANRPAPGTAVITDKGLPGQETEAFFAGDDLRLVLVRPARKDERPLGISRIGRASGSRQSPGR